MSSKLLRIRTSTDVEHDDDLDVTGLVDTGVQASWYKALEKQLELWLRTLNLVNSRV